MELERKAIKNLYISINRQTGKVKISAPIKISSDNISKFISGKIEWVKRHQEELVQIKNRRNYQYLDGEKHHFFGKEYLLETVTNKKRGVGIAGNKIILFIEEVGKKEKRESVLKSFYRQELEAYIDKNRKKWENVVGVAASEWRIRDMKTRWGSCNVKDKRIWISLQIIKRQKEFVDYVMVHELTHLKEKRHNKSFYGLLDLYYPNWKKIRKALKKDIY